MENYLSILKCSECKCVLQSPITLPCSKIVCNKLVPKQGTTYFCSSCQQDHYIPRNGYAPNVDVINLIDQLLPNYRRTFDSYGLFQSTIGRLEQLKNEPLWLIREEIGYLKDQIKQRRGELINEIEKRFNHVYDEMVNYERECVASLRSLSDDFENIENEVKKNRKELKRLQFDLNDFRTACQVKWEKIADINEQEVSRLKKYMRDFESKLFMDKFDHYEKMRDNFCILKISDFIENERFGFIYKYLYAFSQLSNVMGRNLKNVIYIL